MLNLLKNELYRISKAKSFWILSLLLIFIGQIAPGLSGSANGEQISMGSATTGTMGFLNSLASPIIILIVVAGFIASYVCSAFEQRTLQDSIAAGYDRGKIVMSKALCIYVVAFIMQLLFSLSYMIAIIASYGDGMGLEGDIAIRMVLVFLGIFFHNIAQLTVVILVAFALKKVGIVMAISISIFTVGLLLISVLESRYEWLAVLIKFTPFSPVGRITTDYVVHYASYFCYICSGMLWSSILLTITYFGFRKAELR